MKIKSKNEKERLKKNWSSDVIEQKRNFKSTNEKNNSYIIELETKLENFTKLYEEYLNKYNTVIRDKSSSINEYKNDLEKIFDERIQQKVDNFKRQYEIDNDIKLFRDEIEDYKKQTVRLQSVIVNNTNTIKSISSEYRE